MIDRRPQRSCTFLHRPQISPVGPRTRAKTLLNSASVPTLAESGERTVTLALLRAPVPSGSLAGLRGDTEPVVRMPGPAKVISVVQAPPNLDPPPAISFDTVPVPWKGLPLEPALWTLSSTELQGIVSRAIRASAKGSFLRLLTAENLDNVLPAELERLEEAKTSAKARHRFLIQRRNMLLHALNSSFLQKDRKLNEDDLLVSKLTVQLAKTIGDCDQPLEELLQINDQIAQIHRLLDVHSASALAIALRKLNASHSRRTRDLHTARERIFQLEAELEDAWREAENLAKELDDYEVSIADDDDDTTAVIETAAIVPVVRSTSQSPPPQLFGRRGSIPMPMSSTVLTVKNGAVVSPAHITAGSLPHSSSANPMTTFVFPPPIPKTDVNNDAASIKSSKSFRSTKSNKSSKSYASSIQAARKRSFRASQSSLRLTVASGHGKSQSTETPPPMPQLPIQFMSTITCSKKPAIQHPSPQSDLSAIPSSGISIRKPASISSLPVQRQASFDTLILNWRRSDAATQAFKGKSADDICVGAGHKSRNHHSAALLSRSPYSKENAPVSFNWDEDNDIQIEQRSDQPSESRDDEVPPLPPPKDASKTIPSVWKNLEPVRYTTNPLSLVSASPDLAMVQESDTIPENISRQKTDTLSRKTGLLRPSKTLRKIRGLTMRYSASIPPLFNGRSSSRRVT